MSRVTGTRSLAILLAEARHIVSGIDVAAGMVARARDKAAAAGVDAEFEARSDVDFPK
jgi:tRNA/tmRNA/rRNA uracil-C5-methylase (TrmA/RlmC/RlmD family)